MNSDRPILVLNCGSSSLKFALFDANLDPLPYRPTLRGQVSGIGSARGLLECDDASKVVHQYVTAGDHAEAGELVIARVAAKLGTRLPVAIAHRIVHGGPQYATPIVLDAPTIADLRALEALAPLHQAPALAVVDRIVARFPGIPNIACFDTAFHRTLPVEETLLPLPRDLGGPALRRYGFHGLSYDYVARRMRDRFGVERCTRSIVAHLGSGASICALRDLRSAAVSMGFSPLDGLMMGTRCGSIDPGVILHLLQSAQLTPQRLASVLYRESGLLGVSGISSDPRVLLERESEPRARAAVALYVHRIVREIGALTAVLGGLDLLVFTAGVGEHNATLRERICSSLGFLGVVIDKCRNRVHASLISTDASPVRVVIEPTNEEWVAASETQAIVMRRADALVRPEKEPTPCGRD